MDTINKVFPSLSGLLSLSGLAIVVLSLALLPLIKRSPVTLKLNSIISALIALAIFAVSGGALILEKLDLQNTFFFKKPNGDQASHIKGLDVSQNSTVQSPALSSGSTAVVAPISNPGAQISSPASSPSLVTESPASESNATEGEIVRVIHVNQSQSDFNEPFRPTTRNYSLIYLATPGYRIVAARTMIRSMSNAAGPSVEILNDGSQIKVLFALTSGPQFDRYRSWIEADIELKERK
ncbi:hypothetical protein [Caballeronia novacaledonica]|uniref:Uncharacterized protein n=1 Tax=Caballeronia novacaledonica TaxID=1544861 RepID=A0AA37MIN6_9BURK|nr:hypothetical protein [Caballeronia novacaledonica]GJH28153.1 hypothetical protein CBA19CS42_26575 [Caballeronia novacaledonica]